MRSNVTKRRDAGTRLASLSDSPLSCASLATASLSSRVMECSRMSWRSSEQAKPMFTAVSTLSPVSTQRRMPPSASAAMACGTPTCKARATRCASTCGHAHADMGMRTCTCGHAHADMGMRTCTCGHARVHPPDNLICLSPSMHPYPLLLMVVVNNNLLIVN